MYWASRLGGRTIGTEFLVTDLGFQGHFRAGLGVDFSFCLSSISRFHNCTIIVASKVFFCSRIGNKIVTFNVL
jgi:hypothetical protein